MKYKDLNCSKLYTASSNKNSGHNERTTTLLHYTVQTVMKKLSEQAAQDLIMVLVLLLIY
jgi:hypothetical protein